MIRNEHSLQWMSTTLAFWKWKKLKKLYRQNWQRLKRRFLNSKELLVLIKRDKRLLKKSKKVNNFGIRCHLENRQKEMLLALKMCESSAHSTFKSDFRNFFLNLEIFWVCTPLLLSNSGTSFVEHQATQQMCPQDKHLRRRNDVISKTIKWQFECQKSQWMSVEREMNHGQSLFIVMMIGGCRGRGNYFGLKWSSFSNCIHLKTRTKMTSYLGRSKWFRGVTISNEAQSLRMCMFLVRCCFVNFVEKPKAVSWASHTRTASHWQWLLRRVLRFYVWIGNVFTSLFAINNNGSCQPIVERIDGILSFLGFTV